VAELYIALNKLASWLMFDSPDVCRTIWVNLNSAHEFEGSTVTINFSKVTTLLQGKNA